MILCDKNDEMFQIYNIKRDIKLRYYMYKLCLDL